jgi:hypothetical protein
VHPPVFEPPGKGVFTPLVAIRGHHVVVRHEDDRLVLVGAAPPEQEPAIGDALTLERRVDPRVKLLEQPDEVLERRVAPTGDGGDPDHACEPLGERRRLCHGVSVSRLGRGGTVAR